MLLAGCLTHLTGLQCSLVQAAQRARIANGAETASTWVGQEPQRVKAGVGCCGNGSPQLPGGLNVQACLCRDKLALGSTGATPAVSICQDGIYRPRGIGLCFLQAVRAGPRGGVCCGLLAPDESRVSMSSSPHLRSRSLARLHLNDRSLHLVFAVCQLCQCCCLQQ